MKLSLKPKIKSLSFGVCLFLFLPSFSVYANPLEALLKKAQKQKEARQKAQANLDLAQVTLLLFVDKKRSAREVAQLQERFQKEIKLHLDPQYAHHFVLNQIARADMPISIDPLIQQAPQHTQRYTQAPAVFSFFYRGPRLPKEEHLSALCVATDQVWSTLGEGVLANLSTFTGDTPKSFAQRCQQFDLGWIRPEAEVTEKGEIRIISRGLAQFGQPDLETTPLAKSKAPHVFPTFQQHVNQIRRGQAIKVGMDFQGKKVLKCLRPAHFYDRKCVRLTYP